MGVTSLRADNDKGGGRRSQAQGWVSGYKSLRDPILGLEKQPNQLQGGGKRG